MFPEAATMTDCCELGLRLEAKSRLLIHKYNGRAPFETTGLLCTVSMGLSTEILRLDISHDLEGKEKAAHRRRRAQPHRRGSNAAQSQAARGRGLGECRARSVAEKETVQTPSAPHFGLSPPPPPRPVRPPHNRSVHFSVQCLLCVPEFFRSSLD